MSERFQKLHMDKNLTWFFSVTCVPQSLPGTQQALSVVNKYTEQMNEKMIAVKRKVKKYSDGGKENSKSLTRQKRASVLSDFTATWYLLQKFLQEKFLLLKLSAWSSTRPPLIPPLKPLFSAEEAGCVWQAAQTLAASGVFVLGTHLSDPEPQQSKPSQTGPAPPQSCFHPQGPHGQIPGEFHLPKLLLLNTTKVCSQRLLGHRKDHLF